MKQISCISEKSYSTHVMSFRMKEKMDFSTNTNTESYFYWSRNITFDGGDR